MTTQVLFNALTYIDRLVRGGFSQDQARASAEALESALSESVATKPDIADLKHEITSATRDLRLEIAQAKNEILRWAFGFNLILIGAIFAIVKFVH
jgi:hypothetical protein